jgi:hypothetical protein
VFVFARETDRGRLAERFDPGCGAAKCCDRAGGEHFPELRRHLRYDRAEVVHKALSGPRVFHYGSDRHVPERFAKRPRIDMDIFFKYSDFSDRQRHGGSPFLAA